jgi:hypothetical protein
MHSPTRKAFSVLVVVLGTWTAACGSRSSSLTEPGLPSTPGATVQGTVNAGASASSLSTPSHSTAAAIRVTVVGTSLATATDASGRFLLAGIPSGRADLRFEGPGVDARLELSGLVDGQVLTITVQVSGATARVVSEPSPSPSPSPRSSPSPRPSPTPAPGSEVEFSGRVESITPPSLIVAGRTVRTDAGTRIKRDDQTIGLTDLRVGEVVEVEGTRQADGVVLAQKIKVDDANGDDNDDNDNEDDNGGE